MITVIVLLPVYNADRREDAEFIVNSNWDDLESLKPHLKYGSLVFTLTDFMDKCNDQKINLDKFWVTYVNLKKIR